MLNIFNSFFQEKNENFSQAMTKLANIKKKFDGFVIGFPDITPNEIMFIKEKWEILPSSIANGVKIMALNYINEYKTLLTSYNPNSFISPHRHDDEYEHGIILKGELINKFTGKVYKVGDEYTFNPNQIHYLCSKQRGCLVYSTLSVHGKPDSVPMGHDVKKIISYL